MRLHGRSMPCRWQAVAIIPKMRQEPVLNFQQRVSLDSYVAREPLCELFIAIDNAVTREYQFFACEDLGLLQRMCCADRVAEFLSGKPKAGIVQRSGFPQSPAQTPLSSGA